MISDILTEAADQIMSQWFICDLLENASSYWANCRWTEGELLDARGFLVHDLGMNTGFDAFGFGCCCMPTPQTQAVRRDWLLFAAFIARERGL